jgi:hypothetical protein
MRMKRRTLLLTPRRELEAKEEQPLEEEPQLVGQKRKDLSHVQCYVCGEFRHYASQYSQAKKGYGVRGEIKEVEALVEVEEKDDEEEQQLAATAREFSKMFRDKYTLFLDTEDMPGEGWYIDSGATCHMTG